MSISENIESQKQLLAKIYDMAERSERTSTPLFTKFLREEEIGFLCASLRASVYGNAYLLCYGFVGDEAERGIIGFFPDYLIEEARKQPGDYFPLTALKIEGSGYRELSHRDFLGAILSLGVSREVVGDIFVEDGKNAYCVTGDSVGSFIATELCSVGSDKVKCTVIQMCDLPKIERKYEELHDTVASLRLDGVTASFLSVSRDKAEKLCESGLVSVNHTETCDKSHALSEGDLISVRGYGRFRLYEVGGLSKKGRLRITVRKYV